MPGENQQKFKSDQGPVSIGGPDVLMRLVITLAIAAAVLLLIRYVLL